jgi:hypothetical protein
MLGGTLGRLWDDVLDRDVVRSGCQDGLSIARDSANMRLFTRDAAQSPKRTCSRTCCTRPRVWMRQCWRRRRKQEQRLSLWSLQPSLTSTHFDQRAACALSPSSPVPPVLWLRTMASKRPPSVRRVTMFSIRTPVAAAVLRQVEAGQGRGSVPDQTNRGHG